MPRRDEHLALLPEKIARVEEHSSRRPRVAHHVSHAVTHFGHSRIAEELSQATIGGTQTPRTRWFPLTRKDESDCRPNWKSKEAPLRGMEKESNPQAKQRQILASGRTVTKACREKTQIRRTGSFLVEWIDIK